MRKPNAASRSWQSGRQFPTFCVRLATSALRLRATQLLLVALATGLLLGCGAEAYRNRLAETAKYFAYLQKLKRNLSSRWTGPGLSLRPPKQFAFIPPPEPQNTEDEETDGSRQPNRGESPGASAGSSTSEEETSPAVDPRQSELLHLGNFGLPGLEAAWQAKVAVATEEEEDAPAEQSARMYLLSNRRRWAQDTKSEKPLEFHTDLAMHVVGALNMQLPAEEEWHEEQLPRGTGYTQTKTYRTVTLRPDPDDVDGRDLEISLYLYQKKDIQVAVLFVVPRKIRPEEKLHQRIDLCLQTLKVSPEKPKRGQPGGDSGLAF